LSAVIQAPAGYPASFASRGFPFCDRRNQSITTAVLSNGVMQTFKAFLKDDSGATAIEYGLIAAGISVAIIAVVNGVGTKLKSTFSSVSTQLK
jgi:pilus assembly protein Flp/PilA